MLKSQRWIVFAALLGAALPQMAQATGDCGGRNRIGHGGAQLRVVALTADQRLVRFRECSPSNLKQIGAVRGLGGPDSELIGIDYRVQDGKLYGVGNGGGIYQLDSATADATLVSQLTVPLEGTLFGVDFNPAADRLRIVSNTGQNLRHNLNTGGTTLEDADLNNQGPLAMGVTGAAYTNNDLDPNTATTLFDLDASLDQTVIQSPPNNGVLAATGKLAVDAGADTGFDIYTDDSGLTRRQRGFAVLSVNGVSGFYRIHLLSGQAIPIGTFGAAVLDIALPLSQ